MRPSPNLAESSAILSLDESDSLRLREEIKRLRRENRALSIALAEMERVAERDMLTPLFNRRYFLSALHQRIARVDRYDDRVALVYVDVDDLKTINDTYGHAAGDFVLVEVAQRLAAAVRNIDVVARIGGDEFGILMDQVGYSEARGKLRRLAMDIGSTPCRFGNQDIMVAASFGMTMIKRGATAEELLGIADGEMYRAKRRDTSPASA